MADSRHGRSRVAPLVWLGAGLVAVVVVLPSVRRPPPDTANTSAEFSPDAPPDESPDAIIQSLRQAASRTAGGRSEQAIVEAEAVATTTTLPPPQEAASRGTCSGKPPRQTDSLYSAPSAPAFVGDNGGATYQGVTAEEIRIAVIPCSDTTDTSYEGITPDEPPATGVEDSRDRTWRVMQKYFNTNYELYGRKIRFVHVEPDADPTSGPACSYTGYRNAMAEAANTYNVFGVISEHPAVHLEATRRQLMGGGIYGPRNDYFENAYPYEFSWVMDGDKLVKLGNELLCKQVVDRPGGVRR